MEEKSIVMTGAASVFFPSSYLHSPPHGAGPNGGTQQMPLYGSDPGVTSFAHLKPRSLAWEAGFAVCPQTKVLQIARRSKTVVKN